MVFSFISLWKFELAAYLKWLGSTEIILRLIRSRWWQSFDRQTLIDFWLILKGELEDKKPDSKMNVEEAFHVSTFQTFSTYERPNCQLEIGDVNHGFCSSISISMLKSHYFNQVPHGTTQVIGSGLKWGFAFLIRLITRPDPIDVFLHTLAQEQQTASHPAAPTCHTHRAWHGHESFTILTPSWEFF